MIPSVTKTFLLYTKFVLRKIYYMFCLLLLSLVESPGVLVRYYNNCVHIFTYKC